MMASPQLTCLVGSPELHVPMEGDPVVMHEDIEDIEDIEVTRVDGQGAGANGPFRPDGVAYDAVATVGGRRVPLSLRAQAQMLRRWEEMAQPLTAVVARAEVVREQIGNNEWGDLEDQLTPLQASAERLVAQVNSFRAALSRLPR